MVSEPPDDRDPLRQMPRIAAVKAAEAATAAARAAVEAANDWSPPRSPTRSPSPCTTAPESHRAWWRSLTPAQRARYREMPSTEPGSVVKSEESYSDDSSEPTHDPVDPVTEHQGTVLLEMLTDIIPKESTRQKIVCRLMKLPENVILECIDDEKVLWEQVRLFCQEELVAEDVFMVNDDEPVAEERG